MTARRAPATGGIGRQNRALEPRTRPLAPKTTTEAPPARPWRFSTPYPPSTNNLYMTIGKRRVKTQAARDFTDIVGDMASILRVRNGTPLPPYRLTIDLWAPDLRHRDADNGVKCLQDALLKATGHDDAEVIELHVVKRGVDRMYPRADVTLDHVAPSDRQRGEGEQG